MGKIGNDINLSSLSTKKRQQLYGEVFEWLSVKGVQRKMFHNVWRVVVGQLSALKESKHQG